MRRKLTIPAALLLAMALGACGGKKKDEDAEPVAPVQVTAAQRATIERIVTADAILYPVDQSAVMPKISAPVKAFRVQRGDHVRKGQLLAVLENKDLVASAAENKGGLDQAEAQYRTVTSATVPEDLTKAQQDVDAAKQSLDSSQKVFESRQKLFQEGALARRLVDEANVAYAQAKSAYEIAVNHLKTLQGPGRREQVNNVAAQVEAARGKLQGAEAQLSYSEIRSPIDGVVADRPLYPGEIANAGTALVTVVNVSSIIARANVPVSQTAYLKAGETATITQPETGIEMEGKVTVVSAATDPNSTTVEVWVQAVNKGERFKPGGSAHVAINAQTIPDALVIPEAAILPAQEGAGIEVLVAGSDSKAHQKTVQIGVRNDGKAQVLSGLKEGDKVITSGGVGVQDGGKIRITEPGKEDDDKEDKGKDTDKDGGKNEDKADDGKKPE